MKGSRRVVLAIAGVHGSLILGLIFASMLKGCLPKNEKPKILAVVSIDRIVAPIVAPPIPEPVPEPIKPDPPEPTQKLKTPEEIRQRIQDPKKIQRPVEKPEPVVKPKPLLQEEDLDDLLDPPPPPPPPRAPTAQAMSALHEVYDDLYRKAKAAWETPDGLASSRGKTASVRFKVNRSGRIMEYKLVKSSGLPLMDQSLDRAAKTIKSVKRLPPAYKGEHYDFTIVFEITD